MLNLSGCFLMPQCVCGRARCGSINRDRWFFRRLLSPASSDDQRTGVVSRDNGDAWWCDFDGASLCTNIPENNSFFCKYFYQFLGKVRRTLNALGRDSRGSFIVIRTTLADLHLAGTMSFEEYCNESFNPGFLINLNTASWGQEQPEQSQSVVNKQQ